MVIAIQGQRGSACDAVASELLEADAPRSLIYFDSAKEVVQALKAGSAEFAVLALESPIGIPIEETKQALLLYSNIQQIKSIHREVRHCILALPGTALAQITAVASHSIPLHKHRDFLIKHFPDYREIPLSDTGRAARMLAEGSLPFDTAVIAMPQAAEIFNLSVIVDELPANDGYLTHFALVQVVA